MENSLRVIEAPVVQATPENTVDYGLFIGTDVPNSGLTIPFYKGTVEEGHNIPFECAGSAVVRSARISRRDGNVVWLERHLKMTQLFIGLGDQPFEMMLGKPNHGECENVPRLQDLSYFVFAPGHGIMLYKETWHDFPLAVKDSVTCLTMNSAEVVEALAGMKEPSEMDHGDVYKIDIKKRTDTALFVNL